MCRGKAPGMIGICISNVFSSICFLTRHRVGQNLTYKDVLIYCLFWWQSCWSTHRHKILYLCTGAAKSQSLKGFLLQRWICLGSTSFLRILEISTTSLTGGNISPWVFIHWVQGKKKQPKKESVSKQALNCKGFGIFILIYLLSKKGAEEHCSQSGLHCAVRVFYKPCLAPPTCVPLYDVTRGRLKVLKAAGTKKYPKKNVKLMQGQISLSSFQMLFTIMGKC